MSFPAEVAGLVEKMKCDRTIYLNWRELLA